MKGLKNLLKQMGLSAYGNRPQLIQKLTSYEASITGAFNDRLQDAKHKMAVIKAAQNNQPIRPLLASIKPLLGSYWAPIRPHITPSGPPKTKNNVSKVSKVSAEDL